MEHPNATWKDFCTQIVQKDLLLELSSNFLSYEDQTKAKLSKLRPEVKNFRSELKENHVIAIAVTSRIFHPDQQGRQKTNRFCNHCHKNRHTLYWCRRNMRDEEVQKIRSGMSSKRKIKSHKELFH